MTLALPTRTRPASPSRQSSPGPRIVEVAPAITISRLDRVLNDLTHNHWQHAEGPAFPCPLCFDPPLRMAR